MEEAKPSRRVRNVYTPESKTPFRLSRSKIDLFLKCPRCFYLDRRLGVGQPSTVPLSLNNAVDALLKKEFDLHRASQTQHPLMRAYKIDAVPFEDPRMDEWRDALRRGITALDEATNFLITGGVDDVWVNSDGELHIVDYKATAKAGEVSLDSAWQIAYKRQVEIYQWLFRKNGFKVSPVAYFVYCNGSLDKEAFDGKLEFSVTVIPYTGNDAWIPKVLEDAKTCLDRDELPLSAPECEFCIYRASALHAEEIQRRGRPGIQRGLFD